ncbi:MFS general substrate transporter [Hygrophoropsis aurantiaca]|uniref:MFS general substrate transporter n=1 Tax=Hygrophoropsis aurantiaca TaxID=72124 RepID=A0ACB7ZZG8_9AGAM|nr:MFS general substrate transporter [Hygrophoropsis aurantiaca]
MLHLPESEPVCDEETALLPSITSLKDKKQPTPLPKVQISILLMVQLIEPFSAHCIYPFINQLVRELDITEGDERKVGYYAGMIETLFFAAQALTVFQWGRLSDRIGRKPVLLLGVFGLSLSMLCFGLSRTFWGLVLSRSISGALGGNTGVMKSMLGELTDSTNRAQGFALMTLTWSVGVTLGPTVGGILARPQDNFPHVFKGAFWAEYPYFLPCAVAASLAAVTFICLLVFLTEALPVRPSCTTAPVVCGGRTDSSVDSRATNHQGVDSFTSPLSLSEEPVPLRSLMIPSVLIPMINYGALATLEIAMLALLPLFYSTPVEVGGLGFSPATIGMTMGFFGVINGPIQVLLFPPLVNHYGPKAVFCMGIICFMPIFTLFPVISAAAQWWGVTRLIWIPLLSQLVFAAIQEMSFGCILMFITSSAPNRRSLGATVGLAQTTASVARIVGPILSTSMFAFSVQHNLLGGYAIYPILVILSALARVLASRLDEEAVKRD